MWVSFGSWNVWHVRESERGGGIAPWHNVDRGSASSPARIHIYYLCCASVVLFPAGCQVGLVQGGFCPPAV